MNGSIGGLQAFHKWSLYFRKISSKGSIYSEKLLIGGQNLGHLGSA